MHATPTKGGIPILVAEKRAELGKSRFSKGSRGRSGAWLGPQNEQKIPSASKPSSVKEAV